MITVIVLVLMVGVIGAGLIFNVPVWAIVLTLTLLPTLIGLVLLSVRLIPLHAVASQRGFGLSLPEMYALVFRRVPVRRLIDAHARLHTLGTPVDAHRIIELYEAGGGGGVVESVATAMEIAHNAGVRLDWDEAASWSLAGADVVQAAHLVAESRRTGRTLDFASACAQAMPDEGAAFPADTNPS